MTATEEQPAVVQTDTGNLDNDLDFNEGLTRMADKFDQLMVPIREREKAKEGTDQPKPDKPGKPEKPSETKAKETAQPETSAETTKVETPTAPIETTEEPDKRWSKATQENWNRLRTTKTKPSKKRKIAPTPWIDVSRNWSPPPKILRPKQKSKRSRIRSKV